MVLVEVEVVVGAVEVVVELVIGASFSERPQVPSKRTKTTSRRAMPVTARDLIAESVGELDTSW